MANPCLCLKRLGFVVFCSFRVVCYVGGVRRIAVCFRSAGCSPMVALGNANGGTSGVQEGKNGNALPLIDKDGRALPLLYDGDISLGYRLNFSLCSRMRSASSK